MSGGSNASETSLVGTSATRALENAIEGFRREYDKKVETMEEIDDKAMRSVPRGLGDYRCKAEINGCCCGKDLVDLDAK